VIARSFSKILQTAGVSFGILGKKEPCCGDIARRVGELGLFEEQTEGCLDLFDKYDITDLATSSPHCFHTFKNEYPEAPFRARHYTLVLRDLLANGRLRFKKGVEATVTYHDPCYLGRHNQIFDEPREIIHSIPGLRMVEMGPSPGRQPMLRRRGRKDVAGPERRGQDERGPDQGGSSHRRRDSHHRMPLVSHYVRGCPKGRGAEEPFRVMDLNEVVLERLERVD